MMTVWQYRLAGFSGLVLAILNGQLVIVFIEGSKVMEWMIMPLKRYADFQGRSRRMEYWMFALFQFLVIMAFILVFALLVGFSSDMAAALETNPMVWGLLGLFGLIYLAVFFIPGIAVSVRRWHDQNQSGWFVLLFAVLGAIPVVGFLASIAQIVFMCLPGTKGANKYGEDPLNAQNLGDVFR
jgi:uncharacterized membrane protein YhaH (DUF805 family)